MEDVCGVEGGDSVGGILVKVLLFYFSFFSFRQKDEKIEVRNCVLCKGPKKMFSAPLPKHKVDLILSQ